MTTRLVTEKEAAVAVGLDLATFRAWVAAGKLPKPIPECGRFDLKAIDAAIDRVSGLGTRPTRSTHGEQERQKMRVHKGIHRLKVKLANGATTEYHYA